MIGLIRALRRRFVAACLVSSVAWGASAQQRVQDPEPRTASYRLSVSVDTRRHVLSGVGVIEFINQSSVPLDELWFHLYPNAFSSSRSLFLRKSTNDRRSKQGVLFDPGSLTIEELSSDTPNGPNLWEHADPTTPGDPDDTTDRRVPLSTPLEPGEELRLFVRFETKLPFLIERMGYVEDFLAAAQWFPKLARLEHDGRFRHFPYEPLAEFSANFGDYDISIDAPEAFTIAAPGSSSVVARGNGRVTTRFQLQNAHDFAFFAWDRFERFERNMGGTRVVAYAPKGHSLNIETELSLVSFGLEHFQRRFGSYPYSEFVIVHPPDVAAPAGGMEYPGLIVTGGPWYSTLTGSRGLQAVTLHELAHQWFYGIVANDEAMFPVLDEGLSTWAELECLTSLYGNGSAYSGFGITVSATALTATSAALDSESGPLARQASSFRDFSSLSATIYAKAATLFLTLGNVYGRNNLERMLHQYAKEQRFRHPTPDALIDAALSELGTEAARNLKTALSGDGWVDYGVSSLTVAPTGLNTYTNQVVLERKGTLEFPTEVLFELASGESIRRMWDAREAVARWQIKTSSPVRSIMIDPDGSVAIESHRENNGKLAEPPPVPQVLLERLHYFADVLLSGALP